MSEPVLLRPEVPQIGRRRRDLKRDAARDPHAIRFELLDFRGVVRHEPYRFHSEDPEHARRALVRPQVCRKSEDSIRIDRVEAVILEVIRRDLVRDANPAAFPRQIEQDSARGTPELLQRRIQLGPAIAPLRAEHVPGHALGMQSDEDVFSACNLPFYEGHMVVSGVGALEGMDPKRAVPGGESRRDREKDVVAELDVRARHGRRFAKTGAI